MLSLLFFLLPVAALSGFFWGKRAHREEHPPLQQAYFSGLNYLLNEQPDKAIDLFTQLIAVDQETVEIHLTLGHLFRQRGEVERAIRIHQNIITRSHLKPHERIQALYELAQDYLSSGVLDRAEHLFLEVIETGEYTQLALSGLLSIYEQEKEWDKSIETASRLMRFLPEEIPAKIAHYHCELAELALHHHDESSANQHLKNALHYHQNCTRASFIEAELASQSSHYVKAIRALKRVKLQAPAYLDIALPKLYALHKFLKSEADAVQYIEDCLETYPEYISLAGVRPLLEDHSENPHLFKHLKAYPSLEGITYWLKTHPYSEATQTTLITLLKTLQSDLPPYACEQCGFGLSALQWQCPTCKRWDSLKPSGLIEEKGAFCA